MRIVHVEDFFHPESGYQLSILSKYMSSFGHEVIILTSELEKMPNHWADFFGRENIEEKDKAFEREFGVRIIRVPIFKFISGRSIYKFGMFQRIDNLNPDILYVHCEDTYFGIRCILRLHKFKYPVVFDDHMVDISSKNKLAPLFRFFYRNFVTPKLIRHNSIVIRTMEDDFVERRYGIPLRQAPLMGFGSDLMKFHPDAAVKKAVRRELGIPEENFVFVYAGKMDEAKGGMLLAEALVNKPDCNKSVSFLIIGNLVGDYGAAIKDIFDRSQNHLVLLPTQPYKELGKYFQCADAALFPKKCSLTYFDVQACGLPVIIEDNSINITRIDHNNGLLYKTDDIDDFRSKMAVMADMSEDEFNKMKHDSEQYIIDNYNYKNVADEYMKVVQGVYDRYHENKEN